MTPDGTTGGLCKVDATGKIIVGPGACVDADAFCDTTSHICTKSGGEWHEQCATSGGTCDTAKYPGLACVPNPGQAGTNWCDCKLGPSDWELCADGQICVGGAPGPPPPPGGQCGGNWPAGAAYQKPTTQLCNQFIKTATAADCKDTNGNTCAPGQFLVKSSPTLAAGPSCADDTIDGDQVTSWLGGFLSNPTASTFCYVSKDGKK